MLFRPKLEDPTRYHHPQLGQAHLLAKQEVPLQKHSYRDGLFSPLNVIENLAISAGGVEQHTHSEHSPRTICLQ